MRYLLLACDYDGTLARGGQVDEATIDALRRLRDSGRRTVLVTGRELDDLLAAFPGVELFDRIVAENGALVYDPASHEAHELGPPPPESFLATLRSLEVHPLSKGRVIVATREPHETAVVQAIRECGLELQVVFNRGAVMVLPSGLNKASGLAAALAQLGLSRHNCVGIGDAENDHAFLGLCECAVAVADALPAVREAADLVTSGGAGEGVIELVDALIASDLRDGALRLDRHQIALATAEDGESIRFDPHESSLLIAGSSGGGKSSLAAGVLERLGEAAYQFCVVDPEGDYPALAGAIVLGDPHHAPTLAEVVDVLADPVRNVVANLVALPLHDRPAFFAALLPRLEELRTRAGRPHWIMVDEAHHLWPSSRDAAGAAAPRTPSGFILITVHPEHVMPEVLAPIGTVVAAGQRPAAVIHEFVRMVGVSPPPLPADGLEPGQVLVWDRGAGRGVVRARGIPARAERRRHIRKYAKGELGEDQSFYFRGADGKLNLRAYNLMLFVTLAEGVDDETWQHHLRRQDYSRWFRDSIKDPELAADAERVESDSTLAPAESRARIKQAIESRYTLAA
jgi:hydroxymethylpyrimidine pyrophosphatase-like HAD family hydrolase